MTMKASIKKMVDVFLLIIKIISDKILKYK